MFHQSKITRPPPWKRGSVGAAERVILDDVAGVRCVDELAVADIDADMADRVSTAAEEYQIARQKLVTGDAGRGVELRLRHALDRADRVLVDVGRKAGAVKTGRGAAAVDYGTPRNFAA